MFGAFKYIIPDNTTIPAGVTVLRLREDLSAEIFTTQLSRPQDRETTDTYWAKEPIPASESMSPTINPRDVLDENDKSPIIDRDGDIWEWRGGAWRGRGWVESAIHYTTKARIDAYYGPIRFARCPRVAGVRALPRWWGHYR